MGLLEFLIFAVVAFGAWRLLGRFRDVQVEPAAEKLQDDTSASFAGAMKYGREVAVAGESHRNDDGTPRTKIIGQLREGDMVALEREPDNRFDPAAVLVISLKGVIGYVSREDEGVVASWLDDGDQCATFICSIAGGPARGKEFYGVWLRVISIEKLPDLVERYELRHPGD